MTRTPQPTLFEQPQAATCCLADLPLRDWPIGERPIERLLAAGPAALSDAELLAVLFSGGRTNPVALAQQLIATFGGWHGLRKASLADLQSIAGLGRARAAQLQGALEICRRTLAAQPGERLQIRQPADAAQLLIAELGHLDQEELRVLLLDTKNRIMKMHTVYRGSLNSSLVRVGEVFKEAIRLNAAAIIVAHQHPSGDATPSPDDVLVTREIVAAGKLLDIETLDHLVIGEGRYVSMRERGLGFTR